MTEQQSSKRDTRSASSELSDVPGPIPKHSKKDDTILVSKGAQAYEAKPSTKKLAVKSEASSSKQASSKPSHGSSMKRARTVVARSRIFWGRKAQAECDYEVEGPIKDE